MHKNFIRQIALSLLLVVGTLNGVRGDSTNWYGQTSDGRQPLIAPYTGTLYATAINGSTAATVQFGRGTNPNDLVPLLSGLPRTNLGIEVLVGSYHSGDELGIYLKNLNGETSFSNNIGLDNRTNTSYLDKDNSLGLGNHSIFLQTTPNTWAVNLDDPSSWNFDDDDNDVIMSFRLMPTPEPASFVLAVMGLFSVASFRLLRAGKRRSIMQAACFVALVAAISGTATADSVTYNGVPQAITGAGANQFNGALLLDSSPASGTMTVPQWNPADYPGQSLNSVTLSINASVAPMYQYRASVLAFGQGSVQVLSTQITHADISLTLPSNTVLGDHLSSSTPTTISAFYPSEENDQWYPLMGQASDSVSQSYTAWSEISPFIGGGDITMPLNAIAGIDLVVPPQTPSIGVQLQPNPFPYWLGGNAFVSVTYNWVAVPEPSSITLAVCAALGLMFCHRPFRQRSKKSIAALGKAVVVSRNTLGGFSKKLLGS